jgi:hypothetical protein
MIMDCWHDEIERAQSEADVIRLAQDYLFLWSPQELAPLTMGWREIRVDTAADIERIRKWLAEGLAGSLSASQGAAQLRVLRDYFWHAAMRLRELHAASPAGFSNLAAVSHPHGQDRIDRRFFGRREA